MKRSSSSSAGSGRDSEEEQRKIARKTDEENPTLVCPICSTTLWHDNDLNNLHLDACLAIGERAAESTRQEKEHLAVLSHAPGNFKISTVANLAGLYLIEDFISEGEEQEIIQLLDADHMPWRNASKKWRSSDRTTFKKSFGVRSERGHLRLVRQNDVARGERNMPKYLDTYLERLQSIVALHGSKLPHELKKFKPNECNMLSYPKGKSLDAHFDDRELRGPILMGLSMGGFARMTYRNPSNGAKAVVPLPRRCLQLVTGPARWSYKHEIKSKDMIDERRVSITWRQSRGRKGKNGIMPCEVKGGG